MAKQPTQEKANTEAAPAAPQFKRKAAVTLKLTKLTLDTSHFLKVDSEIRIKEIETGEKKEEWPVMIATDLQTGEQAEFLVDKVLQGTLTEKYADNAYVGKAFEIVKSKRTGKKYHDYQVWEIEA